jgi:hypothetical protein
MLVNSLTSVTNIFIFLLIKIQKAALQNIPDKKLKVYPFSKFRSKTMRSQVLETGINLELKEKIETLVVGDNT